MAQKPVAELQAFLSDEYQYIVAIDIGTVESGYAYASRNEINFESSEVTVLYTRCYNSGMPNYMPFKTPTSLLLTKDKKFDSYGFEAHDRFTELVRTKKQSGFYLFTKFKMALYDMEITSNLKLTDFEEKQLPATTVFGKSILAMKKSFFTKIKKEGIEVNEGAIRYVLTVPAIWSDAAKQIMRKSANIAGIKDTQLLIALEPEAASVHCQYVKVKSFDEKEPIVSGVGTRYLVADLGGGTADISVHEKLGNGHLKELHSSRGDKCGGDSINESFVRQLSKIFSHELMKEVKTKFPLIYWEVNSAFEAAKIKFDGTQAEHMIVKLPMTFLESFYKEQTGNDLLTAINLDQYNGAVTIAFGNFIYVEKAYANKHLFKPTADKVVDLMKSILSEVEEGNTTDSNDNINKIILVGGLSESKYIQNAIREVFPSKTIITPESSQLCVLKGAVLFGRNPQLISSRIMRFTYGISTYEPFDTDKHEKERKKTIYGVDYCQQIFTRYVEIGTTVKVNTPVTKCLSTTDPTQDVLTFPIYTSSTVEPKYVDDIGCEKIGQMKIKISNPLKELKYFNVSLICGNTELKLQATDKENTKEYNAELDFLMF